MIASGKLNTTGATFVVRKLDLRHVQEMMRLQREVQRAEHNNVSLQPLSEQEFTYILSGNGCIIGIYVNEKIVAFRAMLVPPKDDPEHLGSDAGLLEQDLHQVIYSEISVVHPAYRGNRLQTYMGEILFNDVNKKQYTHVAATVAPFNIPSIKDKLALGMEIVGLKEKYHGKLRYIFIYNWEQCEKRLYHKTKIVEMSATKEQATLLKEGYRGVAIERLDNMYQVIYQK